MPRGNSGRIWRQLNLSVIMILGKKTFQPVTSKDICLIYELLYNQKLVSFPITEEAGHRIEAIISNVTNLHFGKTVYESAEEKVVAHMYFLIKDHPFTDGNKRTASLTFETLCDLNNLHPNYKDFSLDSLAVYLEQVQEPDHQKVIREVARLLFDHIAGKPDFIEKPRL